MSRTSLAWQRRRAVLGSLGINLYIALSDWALRPMHARGWMQPVIAKVNGLAAIFEFPSYLFIHRTGIREALSSPHRISPSAWFVMWGVSLILWTVALRLLLGILFPRVQEVAVVEGDEPIRSISSRRRFLTNTARVAAASFTGVTAYSMMWETSWFRITHRKLPLLGLRPELAGMRLVQLTDIHHGPTLTLNYVREVIAATNALKPDIVLLTGDYVHRSWQYIDPVVRELSELRASVARLGVLGNHDWWEGAPQTRRAFALAGIPLIDNDRMLITPDRRLATSATEGLCIAGVGDYIEDVINIGSALGNINLDMPRLLMSHNPDVAEDPDLIRSKLRVDLMLCGHTHGGQVWVPGLGTPIIPSVYGQKYASGLVQGPVCPVYISRGIGTTILPLRFCVPPEIAVMDLEVG